MLVTTQTKFLDFLDITEEEIERKEAEMLRMPQAEYSMQHHFSPGIYWRQIHMKAGSIVLGHKHTTTHINTVLTGRATVLMNGELHDIQAPCVLVSQAGVRKVLFIHEDMEWATIHANPDNETNIDILEDRIRIKSQAFLEWEHEMKTLQDTAQPKLQEVA